MIISGKLKTQYRDALVFFAKSIFTHQMYKHIGVRVRFVKNLDCNHGVVYVEDYNALGKPRHFVIEVNKNDSSEEILKTLAHEVVHMRQYARGELNEEMSYWKGTKVDPDGMDYFEHPWEIEAMSIGDKLYREYVKGLDV